MSGRMVTVETPWYETRIMNCSFCGIMMARQYWADDAFKGERFCTEACADVKRRLDHDMKQALRKAAPVKRRARG